MLFLHIDRFYSSDSDSDEVYSNESSEYKNSASNSVEDNSNQSRDGSGKHIVTISIDETVELFSGEYVNDHRTVKNGDAGSKKKSCFESDEIAGVSKHSSLELDCKLDPHNRSKQKWTTTTKFNTYQECSGRKGYRLIKKCPGNSVFWNVLQCCVDIMDFPCKSNCIKPVQRCIHLKN